MKYKSSLSRKLFVCFNYVFLSLIALTCVFPLINMLAMSFSKNWAVTAGIVRFWPVGFNLDSYRYVFSKPEFIVAFYIAVKRTALGIAINMLLTVLAAYPLSKADQAFKHRKVYVWYFMITMLFGGGMIPWYMVIYKLGLINSIWALVLPGAVPVGSVILLLNFFRGLPQDIEEAVFIDGAGYWKSLFYIYLPLSKPVLATLTLFSFVAHWNAWFDGMLLMNSPKKYPLQSYLRTVVVNIGAEVLKFKGMDGIAEINDRTSKAAQLFITALPIMMVYPFLQKHFTKGIVMGSVKG